MRRYSSLLLLALGALGALPVLAESSVYINAGGGSYTDAATNTTWSADVDSNGGWPYSSTTSISNTSLAGLYQTQRINSSGALIYNVPVTNGNYTVILRFAELWFTGSGSRIFNVLVNGAQVQQNLDVVAAAGGRFIAYNIQVPVTVTNGSVNIDLQPVRDNPMISGIDIFPAVNANAVQLHPGDNVQQKVAAQPVGTSFYFNPGTYNNQSIVPKDGDTFQAASGTVLNGSRNLSGSFIQNNGLWYAYDADPEAPTNGICDSTHPGCIYPEELYLNDVQLRHVTSSSNLQPGSWFFDYGNHQVVMADNPSGQKVEVSLTPSAFSGSAANVSISGMRVEKYANPIQFGAIGGQYAGPGWIITNVEVRLNHGSGVQVGSSSQVLNSYLHNNGSIGVGTAGTTNVLVQHNELSFNNSSGFAHDFESGGGKFSRTTGLVVRNNYAHDNYGPGFWTDTDNQNTLYEDNFFFNNQDSGIEHELSFSAVIRNNVFSNNGITKFVWLWGCQFTVQNSQNVEAYGNTINVADGYGNGMGIINQNRGSGQYGPYVSQNNYIHDNDVTFQPGSTGLTGFAADYNQAWFFSSANNLYNSNHYHLSNVASPIFQGNGSLTWAQFQGIGQESSGSIDSAVKAPPAVTWQ